MRHNRSRLFVFDHQHTILNLCKIQPDVFVNFHNAIYPLLAHKAPKFPNSLHNECGLPKASAAVAWQVLEETRTAHKCPCLQQEARG